MVDKIIEHLKRVETDYGIDLTKEIEWLRNIDYEKKYKETLLKARAAKQNTESAVTIGILEEIFPELRESEDEKIRKEFCKDIWIFIPNEKAHKYIAWLEKQGEPTEINPSEFDLRLNKLLKQFETLPKEEFISNLSYYLNVIQNDGTYKIEKQGKESITIDADPVASYYDNVMISNTKNNKKQGKQKPFDYENTNIQQKDFAPKVDMPRYSIGDVLCDKSCITLDKEKQSNFEITEIRDGMYICDKCSFPISQQDEYELVAKRIEQKPWNEEDEAHINSIIDYLLDYKLFVYEEDMNVANEVQEELDWLNKLKQKIGG